MQSASRSDGSTHAVAFAIAAVLHVAIGGIAIWAARQGSGLAAPEEDDRFANARVIEASLVKKGKPKDPKKPIMRETIAPVAPPEGEKVTRSDSAPVQDPKKSPPPVDPRAKVDALKAAQDRARAMAGPDAVPLGDGPEVKDEGDANGSPWGRAAKATGDPYLAEVVGRIQANWEVPETMISNEELQTLKLVACFKVDADGNIVDFRIDRKSRSGRFDRTFEDAVDKTKNVGEPRGEFKKDIMEEGLCLRFDKQAVQ